MNTTTTPRGFKKTEFTDRYGENCSLQESSLATEAAIWFGIDKPKLTVFANEQKGQYLITEMPPLFDVSARMHLTQQMVIDLLPSLTKFAETGQL